jgi:hypothetical protein
MKGQIVWLRDCFRNSLTDLILDRGRLMLRLYKNGSRDIIDKAMLIPDNKTV